MIDVTACWGKVQGFYELFISERLKSEGTTDAPRSRTQTAPSGSGGER